MGGADTDAGVYATLSTGLIGQGVANFGLYLGAPFAALLMALWACWLARLDYLGQKIGFIPLYGLGLILTFALGRDITFLDLYPFVFGYGICWWLNRNYGQRLMGTKKSKRSNQRRLAKQRERKPIAGHYSPPASPLPESEG
jgi:hypothetical protein